MALSTDVLIQNAEKEAQWYMNRTFFRQELADELREAGDDYNACIVEQAAARAAERAEALYQRASALKRR